MAELDLSTMSNEQLAAIAGVPLQTAAPVELGYYGDATGQLWTKNFTPISQFDSLSNEELAKIAGVQLPTQNSLVQSADIIGGQLAKGAAFGYGNELGAAEYAARTKLAGLLTGQQTPPISDLYEQKKQQYGAQDIAFEKTNPYAATGLQIAGGLIPGLLSGGSTLAAIPAQNLPTGATAALVRSLGGALYGSGTAGVPTFRDLAKSGAIGGALYGSGEAENNRLLGAGVGGLTGGVAAPVVGTAVKGLGAVGRYGLDRLAESGAGQRLAQELSSQRGSISTKPVTGEVQTGGFTPAEIYVAKKMKNLTPAQFAAGESAFQAAEQTGVPLYLPDVLPATTLYGDAKYIAQRQNVEAMAQQIENRASAAPSRMTEALDVLSPVRSQYEGATKMTKSADDIIKTAISERTRQTAPFYEQAFKESPVVSLEAVQNLMKQDKTFKAAIESLKQMALYADEPINSTKLILEARKELAGKIYTAKKEKGAYDALEFTYGKVNEILDQGAPMLREADAIYTQLTPPIDELKKSFLGVLKKFSDKGITDLKTLFNLRPEEITALRDKFINAGKLEEWNGGVRAAFQDIVDKKETANFASELIKGTRKREAVKALLGNTSDDVIDTTNQIMQTLEHERLVDKGSSYYGSFKGSPTNTLQEKGANFGGFVEKLKNFPNNFGDVLISTLLENSPSDELALDIAKIYFDPKTGRNVLNKIEPLLRKYQKNKALTEAIVAPATKAAEKTGTISAPSMLIPDVKPKNAAPIKVPEVAKETKVSVPKTDEFPQIKAVQGFTKKEVSNLIDEQPPFVRAVIQAESAGNPKAVSKVGAQGLMQIMPDTAKELGLKNPFDPKENIAAGTKYLTQLEQKYNDKALALAAYNWGPSRVDSALEKAQKKGLGKGLEGIYEMLPDETKNYILRIAKLYNQSIKA